MENAAKEKKTFNYKDKIKPNQTKITYEINNAQKKIKKFASFRVDSL